MSFVISCHIKLQRKVNVLHESLITVVIIWHFRVTNWRKIEATK